MEKTLFRAKRKDNNEWVMGYLLQKYILPVNNVLDRTKSDGSGLTIITGDAYEIDKETICRCTELNDMDDIMLFEGDNVEALITPPHSNNCIKISGNIVWDSGTFFVKYNESKRHPIYNCSCLKKIR